MVAYAQYFNDARIKAYVSTLTKEKVSVDVVCLKDDYSKNTMTGGVEVNIIFVQDKYQGSNALRYLVNYLSFFVRAFVIITKMYFREGYPIVHVHNQPDFLIFCALVPKIFGAKVILDMHDIMIAAVLAKFSNGRKSFLYYAAKLQSRLSVGFTDTLICADHSQRDFLKENGITHRDTVVIMNLPDKSTFHRRNTLPVSRNLKLIYHGTISRRLGLDLVVQAVMKAAKIVPVTLTVIGNGEQKESLVQHCCRSGLLDSVFFFRDFMPVEQLQEEIEKYDAGIIGNRRTIIGERCMLPVKLMEYLVIGLPVIVPRLEIIERYFAENMVYFYEPESVTKMMGRILEVAADQVKARRKVLNADHFFQEHNWEKQANEYLRIIFESP